MSFISVDQHLAGRGDLDVSTQHACFADRQVQEGCRDWGGGGGCERWGRKEQLLASWGRETAVKLEGKLHHNLQGLLLARLFRTLCQK